MTATDTGVLRALDFTPTIVCEIGIPGATADCRASAASWFRCRDCGHILPICHPHRLEFLNLLRRKRNYGIVRCPAAACGQAVPAREWRDGFELITVTEASS